MAESRTKSFNSMTIYDALYMLVSDGGREDSLFGSCAPLARKAFRRSLIGDGVPTVWFEIPLAGPPRFDLHVALSRETLCPGARFQPGAGNGYDELFRWFADEEKGGGGLAFAYDISEGRVDNPAAHVNIKGLPLSDMSAFFDRVADHGASRRYEDFVGRLPKGWLVWYAGVHPGRPGSPVRVDCFVATALQDFYATDVSLFERDLRACGFTALGPVLYELAALVLESPFGLELQFDVMGDGTLGNTLGISASFPFGPVNNVRPLFEEGGTAAELLGAIERFGLADSRWRQIAGTVFTTLAELDSRAIGMYCVPTFVKLRMRDGAPFDAKVYLQAGAKTLPA